MTTLHNACWGGVGFVLDALVPAVAAATLSAPALHAWSPLMMAVYNGHEPVATRLVQLARHRGVDLLHSSVFDRPDGRAPALRAARARAAPDAAEAAAPAAQQPQPPQQRGEARPKSPFLATVRVDEAGDTLLHLAARAAAATRPASRSPRSRARSCARAGRRGRTPLMRALQRGNGSTARLLLALDLDDAELGARTDDGLAAPRRPRGGATDFFAPLAAVDYRVVADPDDQGLTPLAWALRDGDEADAGGPPTRPARSRAVARRGLARRARTVTHLIALGGALSDADFARVLARRGGEATLFEAVALAAPGRVRGARAICAREAPRAT